MKDITDKLKSKIKAFLENDGWKVFEEFWLAAAHSRFDLFGIRENETIIVEIKADYELKREVFWKTPCKVYGPYDERSKSAILYRVLGQVIWYSQYADTVWLIASTEICQRLSQMTIELPNIEFFTIERWLEE
mgnify:CR=1 FL=1